MKRVGVAALLHESNTFLSVPTDRGHFEQASLTKGSALLDRWEGSNHELGGFIKGAKESGYTPFRRWQPTPFPVARSGVRPLRRW